MTRRLFPVAALLATMFGGCASAPVNYYTLIAADTAPDTNGARRFAFDLQPVSLPAQVDQPQLVVRQQGAAMALVESERWIAPLADEVRGAIASELANRHRGDDLSGLPLAGRPVVRIKVELRRFDSQPGQLALLDAAWSLRRLPGDAPALACSSRIEEPVGAGYDALVLGHQRALARLATVIATSATELATSGSARCP